MNEWVCLRVGFSSLDRNGFMLFWVGSCEDFDCNNAFESLQGDQEWQRTSQQERSAHSQGGGHFRGELVLGITSPALNFITFFMFKLI